MSTMTMPSARQPFASLSGTRLKNVTNVKNQQNGRLFGDSLDACAFV